MTSKAGRSRVINRRGRRNDDLNPYWNATSYHHQQPDTSTSNSSTSVEVEYEEGIIEIPAEDANNVVRVSNETVIIYPYGNGMQRTRTTTIAGGVVGGGGAASAIGGHIVDWERERIRMEFYATYDVMTGLRIAGTLAAFFGLMVMLVMYKSRRAVKDPQLAAVAAEMVQEEEDRELQQAFDTLEAAGIFSEIESLPYRERRLLSLGNISAPPTLTYSPRFSSVGGGGSCSLWEPTNRSSATAAAYNSPLPSGSTRRDAFRNSRNSCSSDRSQCVSFDMSEMSQRRRSDTRAWMGRRATFQSIQGDSLKYRNKVFLSNTRQGRDANRIKLIRLYTTSSSREEDVEEVVEHALLPEEEDLTTAKSPASSSPPQSPPPPLPIKPSVRQQSTSTASFIVSSVDYQDSDLRSVGSESMFSERYADTDDDEERRSNSSSSEGEGTTTQVARLKSGGYQQLQQSKRSSGRIDDCTIETYEAAPVAGPFKPPTPPPRLRRYSSVAASGDAAQKKKRANSTSTTRPKSDHYESRTFELQTMVPKSYSVTGGSGGSGDGNASFRLQDSLCAIGGRTSRDMVHQLLRKEEQQKREGTTTNWSKETLF